MIHPARVIYLFTIHITQKMGVTMLNTWNSEIKVVIRDLYNGELCT